MKIIFDRDLKKEILQSFGKSVDSEGYLIDSKNSKRVLTNEGEEITLKEFAGITKGSEIYLKSDIISLIKYIDTRE